MSQSKRDSRKIAKPVNDIGEELHQWAVQESGFRPRGRHVNKPLPTPQDLKLLCRGPMADVWQYVIKHVKTRKNAQKIKGNLKIQQLLHNHPSNKSMNTQPAEKEKLLSQYTDVSKELSDLSEKVKNVHKDIKHLEKEILTSEKEHKGTSKAVSDVQKRNALLLAYSRHCDNIIKSYEQLTKQFRDKMDNLKVNRESRDTTFYSVQHGTPSRHDNKTGTALESSCTKSVRETCESLGTYLKGLCDHSDPEMNDNINTIKNGHTNKDQLWMQVEAILNKHSSENILLSLVSTTHDSTTTLQELTSLINLKRDAQELKFMFEKGKLTDTSRHPLSLLPLSVHQLIEEGQCQHFKCFLDAEKAANECWKLFQELQVLNQDIENRIESRYRGLPGTADLTRSLYHSEVELAAAKESLHYFKSQIKDLENKRQKKILALETLQSKYNQIKDFEKLAQAKQSVIQALVKQNSTARTNLEKHKHEIAHYIQSKVCPHQAHIVAMVAGLHQAVSREVDKFASLAITRLQHINMPSGERFAVDELSIYRLEGLNHKPGGTVISQTLDKLDFPLYKAPEELLPRIIEIKETSNDLSTLVEKREQDIQELDDEHSTDDIVNHFNSLQHEVNQHDDIEMSHIVPRVQEGLKETSKALTQCIAVKDCANAWWDQPAQYLVPRVKEDDMNLRQWLDQWTLHATRLRQLEMHH